MTYPWDEDKPFPMKRRGRPPKRKPSKPSSNGSERTVITQEEAAEMLATSQPQKPLVQQSRAVQARWAGQKANEQDLRAYFQELELDKALLILEQMRKNCQTAGQIINSRINLPENLHCKTCGISWKEYEKKSRRGDWFLRRPHYHPQDRNIIVVDVFCCAACLSLENNKTQGVRGISDRGMMPEDNPQNHPRQVTND